MLAVNFAKHCELEYFFKDFVLKRYAFLEILSFTISLKLIFPFTLLLSILSLPQKNALINTSDIQLQ